MDQENRDKMRNECLEALNNVCNIFDNNYEHIINDLKDLENKVTRMDSIDFHYFNKPHNKQPEDLDLEGLYESIKRIEAFFSDYKTYAGIVERAYKKALPEIRNELDKDG